MGKTLPDNCLAKSCGTRQWLIFPLLTEGSLCIVLSVTEESP